MMFCRFRPTRRGGFTTIELLLTVVVIGVVLALAAPSMKDMLQVQRLRSTTAQVMTDLQFARNEAVSRGTLLRVYFRTNATMTCYSLYTSPNNTTRCNCLLGPGSACTGSMTELRTVQFPVEQGISVYPPSTQDKAFAFDPTTGGIYTVPTDNISLPMDGFTINSYIDSSRSQSIQLKGTGRPTVCAPSGSIMGDPSCT
jgi:type IV fimbrial biogenesis protein FimT